MSTESSDSGRLLANARKRRGVARASLTRLNSRLNELEGEAGNPRTLELAQRMSQKLSDLEAEFLTHHHAVIDLIEKEQEILDTHDDTVAELSASAD